MPTVKTKEGSVHKQVVEFIKLQYPAIIFHTDFAAGCKMTMGQAIKNAGLQSGKSWPDLFIPEPVGNYHGLFIEIKKDKSELFYKDGETIKPKWVIKKTGSVITKYDHHAEQVHMQNKLKAKGYAACFGCGFDECVRIIKHYIHGTLFCG